VTLDAACADLPRVEKIDVEGFEEALLSGARALRERDKPAIMAEVWRKLQPAWSARYRRSGTVLTSDSTTRT
jgi:hypothetical protein